MVFFFSGIFCFFWRLFNFPFPLSFSCLCGKCDGLDHWPTGFSIQVPLPFLAKVLPYVFQKRSPRHLQKPPMWVFWCSIRCFRPIALSKCLFSILQCTPAYIPKGLPRKSGPRLQKIQCSLNLKRLKICWSVIIKPGEVFLISGEGAQPATCRAFLSSCPDRVSVLAGARITPWNKKRFTGKKAAKRKARNGSPKFRLSARLNLKYEWWSKPKNFPFIPKKGQISHFLSFFTSVFAETIPCLGFVVTDFRKFGPRRGREAGSGFDIRRVYMV